MYPPNSTADFNAQIVSFLSNYPPGIVALVEQLRLLVQNSFPAAVEQLDIPAKMLAYGFKPTYRDTLCVIMPYKTYVNLGFPRGATLADPLQLLTGTGKRARHVKITALDKNLTQGLLALLQASRAQLDN